VSVSVLVIVAVAPPTVLVQTRSEIIGTIRDSSGAVLPGVTLTLTSPNMVGQGRLPGRTGSCPSSGAI
jgi:hypothetical protein